MEFQSGAVESDAPRIALVGVRVPRQEQVGHDATFAQAPSMSDSISASLSPPTLNGGWWVARMRNRRWPFFRCSAIFLRVETSHVFWAVPGMEPEMKPGFSATLE